MPTVGPLIPGKSDTKVPIIDSSEGLPDINNWEVGDLVIIEFPGGDVAFRKNASDQWVVATTFGSLVTVNLSQDYFTYQNDLGNEPLPIGVGATSVDFEHAQYKQQKARGESDFYLSPTHARVRSTMGSSKNGDFIESDVTYMYTDLADKRIQHRYNYNINKTPSDTQEIRVGGTVRTKDDAGAATGWAISGTIGRWQKENVETNSKSHYLSEWERGFDNDSQNDWWVAPDNDYVDPVQIGFTNFSSSDHAWENLVWTMSDLQIYV